MGVGGRSGVAPSGTVTFLFTDVEGSTRLWAADSDAMAASLRVHDDIVRGAVESRGGFVFTTAGDSFAVAFAKASQAVEAAVAAQQALASAAWPGPHLRVRMGLHLGEAEERGGDYFGPVVNACARVEAAGHGGQVLVTDAVRSVIGWPDLVDLGSSLLRDLPEPMRIFQVGAGAFPPLRGLVGARDSLPVRRTRLLGRDRELASLVPLLLSERLVTLVGPGGIGKTSLAIEAAGHVSEEFQGGAHFADLAPVSDPDDIVAALCRGVQLTVTSAPYERLCDYLASSATLIVVDNCEHLIDDAAELVDRLLKDVPSLHLLATSREFLDLDGERVVRVDPLPSQVGSAAVRLFVERVVEATPSFDPSADDLEQISNICGRLDGLPLAIELAAGRARSMTLSEIYRGLDDRFTLLAGGRRGKLRRQQTLRAAIDWSIELLEPAERSLLTRLAVFAGTFPLGGAAALADPGPASVADCVASLTAKSLIDRVDDVRGEARFRLLETVREWGLEEMLRSDQLREVRDLHADWYLAAADELDAQGWNEAAMGLRWVDDMVDAAAAAVHLRDRDVEGAALILAVRITSLVESGLGTLGREIQRAARAGGWSRSPCRQWRAEHGNRMNLLEDFPFDDPPPDDDGSFEWRYLVGGADFDNAGLLGWYRTWLEPAAVVAETRALEPVAPNHDSRMIRAAGMANSVQAFVHLGYFEEAVAAFEESRRLAREAGRERAGMMTEIHSLMVAATCLDLDLREAVAANEAELGWRGWGPFLELERAVISNAPAARRVEIARAAREHCRGRWPGEESLFLAYFGYFALADGDVDHARHLSESVVMRTPGTASLMRHNLIRANGEPLELISDQGHHRRAMAAQVVISALANATNASIGGNRQKLRDEVARILD